MAGPELIEPKRLKGFRDYLPDVMAARWSIIDSVRAEAALAGFQPIGTPALEYAQTLLGQGEETDKQVYRFKDHGDRDVALRFDLTVPFARFVAEHQGTLVFPFKKLQLGDVWRGENTQKGRYREFMQCDLDVVGVDTMAADIEILAVFQRILAQVACGPFTMAVGNRLVLSALIRRFLPGIAPAAEPQVLVAIDKLAKIGADKVNGLIAAVAGATPDGAAALMGALAWRNEGGDSDLPRLKREFGGDGALAAELDRLTATVDTVRRVTAASAGESPRGRLVVDLSIARGLGYYTGVVFETTLDSLPGFGSVCSGGRYNGLVSRFSARELPGVGGSVGLDRLVAGLEELGVVGKGTTGPVFLAVATADAQAYGFELAALLRRAGLPTEIGLVSKLANQFRHADRLGCPIVITVGTDECAQRTFALKIMATGEDRRGLPAADLVGLVQAALGGSGCAQ